MEFIKCPICGFITENLCFSHIKTHGYANTKSFKLEFGLLHLQSDRLRNVQRLHLLSVNPTIGKEHRADSILKMSKNRAGKGLGVAGKYIRTKEIREKISNGVVNAHLRGDFDNAKLGNGEFIFSKKANKTIFVRSGWEKRILFVLENCYEINYFDYEPFVIDYEFNGSNHKYIPDFYVMGIYGVEEVWEIKRDDLVLNKDPKTIAKIDALHNYCKLHGYNSRLILLKDIIDLEKIVKRQNG